MHAYIIQQLIRIILFITIGLPIGLKSFAQETKRFYMELDTPRQWSQSRTRAWIKIHQHSDFDSVSPPDFGTLIETVEGATPHKAGHTVKNGILTDIYEQGFSYRIRFKKPGNTKLPLASIKANGKEYETPLTSVWVHPVDTNIDSVKQHSAGRFLSQRSFHAIGICLLTAWFIDPLIVSETKKNKEWQDK